MQEVLAHAKPGYLTIRHFIRLSKAVHPNSGRVFLNAAKKDIVFSTAHCYSDSCPHPV